MQKKNAAFRKARLRATPRRRLHKRRLHQPVSQQVIETLISGITDLRDRAIILVLADSGARVSELLQLSREDIKIASGAIGDGFRFAAVGTLPSVMTADKLRKAYLSARALEALNAYLETRGDSNAALFTDASGKRMTTQQVRWLLHVWCDRLGVKRFPIHDFRRRMAEGLIAGGMSVNAVAIVLGWSVRLPFGKPSIRLHLVRLDDHGSIGASD